MNCSEQRCCVENRASRSLPASSISPNAYCGCSLENRRAASANVIHPRSPVGKLRNEDASALSLVPDSLGASGGAAFAGLKIFLSRSPTPIRALRTSCLPCAQQEENLAAARKNNVVIGLYNGGARGGRTPTS